MRYTLFLVVILAARVHAQTALPARAALRVEPGGRTLVTLAAGTRVTPGTVRNGFTQITVDGFVDSSVVRTGRAEFPLIVTREGARLRAEGSTSAGILAQLPQGMGLSRVSRRGDWIRVRRSGWIATRELTPARAAVAAKPPPAPARPVATRGAGDAPSRTTIEQGSRAAAETDAPTVTDVPVTALPGAMQPARALRLRLSPDADAGSVATADSGVAVAPIARERGWVRVRIEGWVPESELLPTDTALRVSLSAADLRADPEAARGKVVRWEVTFYALQRADPLRRDLAPNESYMLARGPGDENSLLYLAVPPSLLPVARGLPAMAELTVTARVRNGRSEPVGVPLLDLQSITRR